MSSAHDGPVGPGGLGHDADTIDLLISRTVDGTVSPAEWVLFQGYARDRLVLWKDLALTYRQAQMLEQVVGVASAHSELVGLQEDATSQQMVSFAHTSNVGLSHAPSARPGTHQARGRHRSIGLLGIGGWATAAMLALGMVSQSLLGPTLTPGNAGSGAKLGQTQAAGLAGVSYLDSLAASLAKGKEEGRVIAEVPENEVIQTTPNEDGTYTVLYTRRIVEQARIPHFYRASTSESGKPAAVRIRPLIPSNQRTKEYY